MAIPFLIEHKILFSPLHSRLHTCCPMTVEMDTLQKCFAAREAFLPVDTNIPTLQMKQPAGYKLFTACLILSNASNKTGRGHAIFIR